MNRSICYYWSLVRCQREEIVWGGGCDVYMPGGGSTGDGWGSGMKPVKSSAHCLFLGFLPSDSHLWQVIFFIPDHTVHPSLCLSGAYYLLYPLQQVYVPISCLHIIVLLSLVRQFLN